MQHTSRLYSRGYGADSLSISSLPHHRVSLERNLEGDQFMRRYQKWLSAGLMALTPSLALAGPLNSPIPKGTGAPTSTSAKSASNQETANKIAAALRKAKLNGYEIEISVQNGVATLDGMVATKEQRAAAQKAASVAGISKVNNRLAIGDPAPRQTAAMPRSTGRSQPIRPANYQGAGDAQDGLQPTAPPPAMMGTM